MNCFVYKNRRHGKPRNTYRGRYRLPGDPKPTEVSLGERDKQQAYSKLRKIYEQELQVRAGILPPRGLREGAQRTLVDHLDDFTTELTTRGRDSMYVYNVEKIAARLCTECHWIIVKDITPESFQKWRREQNKAPKTLNQYLATTNALLNWMLEQQRILVNPLHCVKPVETRGRERRMRRASSDEDIRRLLEVSGSRAVVYLFAVLTGLRRAEIAALVWNDVHLDADKPFIHVRASTTKNHLEADIKLHPDLVPVLRSLGPGSPELDSPLFSRVPTMYMLKKDLAAAGIPYKDAQGRLADFHALRHTFGTRLSRAGVQPRVAMELMRHSDLRLTMNVYTDPTHLPTAAAIDSLPSLLTAGGPLKGPLDLGGDCQNLAADVTTCQSAGGGKDTKTK